MSEEALASAPAAEAAQLDVAAPEPSQPSESAPQSPVPSRREALERAFAKVDADEGRDAAGTQERGPDGRFTAKAGDPQPPEPPVAAKPEGEAKTPPAGIEAPPSRFSPDAKAAWEQAPEAIRGEVNRAIREMEAGIRQKDEMLAPLKPFFDMAKQHQVELPKVLGNYVAMEQLLAKDPRSGLNAIAQNMGMSLPAMLQKAGLTGSAEGQPQGPDPRDQEIAMLRHELTQIKGEVGTVSQTIQQQREAAIMADVQRFASDPAHARFAELEADMLRMLETGFATTLDEAYQFADRLKPAPQPVMPAPQPAPQPRPVRSVTGAPASGSAPDGRQPSTSRREALERGFRAAGLS